MFVFKDIKSITVTGPMTVQGRHEDAVGRRSRRTSTSTAASASWREAQLHDGKNCYKDMIGTGPFKLQSWVPNNQLVVVKNPNYWRKDSIGQQLPYLDQITFKPVPDPSAMLNGLQSHAFDLANTDDTTTVIPRLLPRGHEQVDRPGGRDRATRRSAYTIFNTSKVPFNNILARQAFAYAYDKTLYNKLRQTHPQRVASGPFGPGVLGYLPDSGLPSYNLATAKAQGRGSTRRRPGRTSRFTLSIPNDAASQAERRRGRRHDAEGGHEGVAQAGGAVAADQRRDRRQLPGRGVAQPPRLRPRHAVRVVALQRAGRGGRRAGTPASPNIGVPSADGQGRQQLRQPGELQPVQRPGDQQGPRHRPRRAPTPPSASQAYEDINKEFAKQVWTAWGVLVGVDRSVPDRTSRHPRAEPPDRDGRQRDRRRARSPYTGLSSGTDVSALWLKTS